jgi:pilus assembly protein CpaF
MSDLMTYFSDPAVDELVVNGGCGMWLVRGDRLRAASSPFAHAEEVAMWAQELARQQGIRLDPLCGAAGGSLPEQAFRWHCVLPPLAPDGTLFSLRRHRFDSLCISDFRACPNLMEQLRGVMQRREGLLIAGPTGSGKTTLLAALLRLHAASERVILVESLSELPLPSPCSVRLLERRPNLEGIGAVGLTRLVQEALRLRPDRLVIGEIRGHEAGAFCESLMSGHEGVMSTIHASNPDDAIARLSFLASSGGLHRAPTAWPGLELHVAMLERCIPPRLVSLSSHRFVPSG